MHWDIRFVPIAEIEAWRTMLLIKTDGIVVNRAATANKFPPAAAPVEG